jgi:nicotinic acid mononucleotide adenylyltransferase
MSVYIVVKMISSHKQCIIHLYNISSQEERAQVSVGTASLLEFLHSTEPEFDFSFCLGADAFLDLTAGKWKESTRVLKLLEGRLVVLYRQTGASSDTERDAFLQERVKDTPGARLVYMDHLNDISSSQVRACRDEGELATMVVPDVLAYMKEHKLYQFAKEGPS